MKRKIIIVLSCLALVIGLFWYNHKYYCYFYPFVTTSSGLSYKAIGRGNGRKVKDGEWVALSFVVKVSNKQVVKKEQADQQVAPSGQDKVVKKERILMTSRDLPQPFLLPFCDALKERNKPFADMIGMVQEKQLMIFKFSPKYYFGVDNKENFEKLLKEADLQEDDELVVNMKLEKIMTNEERIQMIEARRVMQLEKDSKLIISYLASNNMQASSTDFGLFYIIDQPTQEVPVVKDKIVKVNYTGRLLNGTVFDTSLEEIAKANKIYSAQRAYKPFEFKVGSGAVIEGWDKGLLLLKKNEKARFFIPSTLAYGENAMGSVIPANSILMFEVEVVDVC